MKQVYVKEQVCMGCHLCEVYCLQKHAHYKDLVKAYKKESPRALSRVRVDESGIVSLSVRCQHCADAPCIRACLTGALSRDSATSLVTVDEERCIGCGTCSLTCPLGVPKLDTAQDFLGEYMAGGVLILLGMNLGEGKSHRTKYVGTGMHGGVIYIHGNITEYQLGKEVGIAELDEKDWDILNKYVTEFAAIFGYSAKQLTNQEFIKLYPRFLRPYGRLYAY